VTKAQHRPKWRISAQFCPECDDTQPGRDVQAGFALENCRFLAAGPLGMETSGPRTTRLALERLSNDSNVTTSIEWPGASPSVPASRFHTAIHGVRLCLRLGVHALAIPLPSSLANANRPSDSSRGRVLLKPSDGIVPSVFSSNIIDNATRHPLHASNVGTSTDIPPDLKRYCFGRVYCPAVSESNHPKYACINSENVGSISLFIDPLGSTSTTRIPSSTLNPKQ
jgi:hypothetical protein